jgi:hypothetical protein
MEDKQIIKALIIVAAVLVLVIEGMTFFGLVGSILGGGGDGAATDAATPVDRVGSGDELLSETDRTETLTTFSLQSGDRWTLTVTVTVENTGDTPYELRLGTIRTTDGDAYEASATTGPIAPNETGTVTAQWSMSSGATPDTVAVTAVENPTGASRVLVEREVALGRVPVQG